MYFLFFFVHLQHKRKKTGLQKTNNLKKTETNIILTS